MKSPELSHEDSFQRDLRKGITNDLQIIEDFLRFLTATKDSSQEIGFGYFQELLNSWDITIDKRQRLHKIVQEFLDSQENVDVHREDNISLRQILRAIQRKFVAISRESLPLAITEKKDQTQAEQAIYDGYISYLKKICGYEPERRKMPKTIYQLQQIHQDLTSRSSADNTARAKRIAERKMRRENLKDAQKETSAKNKQTPNLVRLIRKKNIRDSLTTRREYPHIADIIDQVDFLPIENLIYVIPHEQFYTLSYEEQQKFIQTFESEPHFVVMENISRIEFPVEKPQKTDNYFDRLLGKEVGETYTEQKLLKILEKIDQENGITGLSIEYQNDLLQDERFAQYDLIDPDFYNTFLTKTIEELQGVFTSDTIKKKFETLRIHQIHERLLNFNHTYANHVYNKFTNLLSLSESVAKQRVEQMEKYEINGKFSMKDIQQREWPKPISIDDSSSVTYIDVAKNLTYMVWQDLFHGAKEVPFEILFELIRCILLQQLGRELKKEANEIGEQNIKKGTADFVKIVNRWFKEPIQTDHTINRNRFFSRNLNSDQDEQAFLRRKNFLEYNLENSGLPTLNRLYNMYITLVNADPHVSVSKFAIDENNNSLIGEIYISWY